MLDQVRRSTVDKAAEIVELRRLTVRRDAARLADCARAMARSFTGGGRLFGFGNGGSSTDARGGHDLPSPSARPAALARDVPTDDVAIVTALSNDVGFDVVFARQLAALGRPGDIAVGLSTSGDSENLAAPRGGKPPANDHDRLHRLSRGKMAQLTRSTTCSSSRPRSTGSRRHSATVYHVLWELTQVALEASDGS